MTSEEIKSWYRQWCKKTKRGGSILITSSIQELLQDFQKNFEDTKENSTEKTNKDK